MTESDQKWMRRAIEIASHGRGFVEPNPMVGCVITRNDELVAEGYHERFGGPHAEVNAIAKLANHPSHADLTVYVTLEPCCHVGKTPPCTEALIALRPSRVVIAHPDPFPKVNGGGVSRLRQAGINVAEDVLREESSQLLAPYLKRVSKQLPWVIAKWAMTLDGRIATSQGESRWISCDDSREIVQRLRSRVDGILVGISTVLKDDPMLTPRPNASYTGPKRKPLRIIADTKLRIPIDSQIVQTAQEHRTLIVCTASADSAKQQALQNAGCNVVGLEPANRQAQMKSLLHRLSDLDITNLLVEGGSEIFGSLLGGNLIDEVRAFVAPKLLGGKNAPGVIGGEGVQKISEALEFCHSNWKTIGSDLYFSGRIRRT